MRSLVHETAAHRTWTSPRHETWDVGPTLPARRASLRRALRQGLLRAATRARAGAGTSAANEQVPAQHDRTQREQQPGLPDPARVASA